MIPEKSHFRDCSEDGCWQTPVTDRNIKHSASLCGCCGLLIGKFPRISFTFNKHIGELRIQQLKDIFQWFLMMQCACGDVYCLTRPCTNKLKENQPNKTPKQLHREILLKKNLKPKYNTTNTDFPS